MFRRISTKDRLPESEGEYFVILSSGAFSVSYFKERFNTLRKVNYWLEEIDVKYYETEYK